MSVIKNKVSRLYSIHFCSVEKNQYFSPFYVGYIMLYRYPIVLNI